MRKKPCSFPTVPVPLSPTPPSPASSSTPGIRHGHWKPPTPLAPPPGQTKFPSVINGAAPLLKARKASNLCRSFGAYCTLFPVNAPSSTSLLTHVVFHTASQYPLLPNSPPGPFLSSGPLGIGSLVCPPLGTWPTTQSFALTGNQTCGPLVGSLALSPLSHSIKVFCFILKFFLLLFYYSCPHFPPITLPCPTHPPPPTFNPSPSCLSPWILYTSFLI